MVTADGHQLPPPPPPPPPPTEPPENPELDPPLDDDCVAAIVRDAEWVNAVKLDAK